MCLASLGLGTGAGHACKAAGQLPESPPLSPCPCPEERPPNPSHGRLTGAEAGGALPGSSANRGVLQAAPEESPGEAGGAREGGVQAADLVRGLVGRKRAHPKGTPNTKLPCRKPFQRWGRGTGTTGPGLLCTDNELGQVTWVRLPHL